MHLTSKKKAHRLVFTMIFCLLALAVLAYLGFLLWEVIEFPFAMRESFLLSLFGGLMVFAFGGLSLGLAEGFGFGLATSIAIAFDLGCFGTLALYLIHGAPVSWWYFLKLRFTMGFVSGLAYSALAGLITIVIAGAADSRKLGAV